MCVDKRGAPHWPMARLKQLPFLLFGTVMYCTQPQGDEDDRTVHITPKVVDMSNLWIVGRESVAEYSCRVAAPSVHRVVTPIASQTSRHEQGAKTSFLAKAKSPTTTEISIHA
jgi:hypothetical protein